MRRYIPVYLMLLPGIIYFLMFKYAPMWGILMAFKNYKPVYGFFGSKWIGLENFRTFFLDQDFLMLLKNTFILAVYNIAFYFPLPIVMALMIHELKVKRFTQLVRSVIYLPHFISWVVVVAMMQSVFGADGPINAIVSSETGKAAIPFLYSTKWFRSMILIETIWKESGWGTIVFAAALTAVNNDLYEAATIDGANRFQKMLHVTLPAIRSTIVVMFLLRVGRFLDTGFEQIFLLLNASNRTVGQVFDTYVYETGLLQGQFSYAITISIFKSLIGLTLVGLADRLAKRLGEDGIL
jgi:putative aldouronate transport system permease protein